MTTARREIPLSSFGTIPLTDETRQRLRDAGMPEGLAMSEGAAQALLTLRFTDTPPDCYAVGYDPAKPLCRGCIFSATCWRGDSAYMARIADSDGSEWPYMVPAAVVVKAIDQWTPTPLAPVKTIPPPPRAPRPQTLKTRPPPPPPPPRKT